VRQRDSLCAVRFGGRYEDLQEAENAIRDILHLFYQLTDYNGIVGDHARRET
jgi:hypothetical protein